MIGSESTRSKINPPEKVHRLRGFCHSSADLFARNLTTMRIESPPRSSPTDEFFLKTP
jgi:hypothetical protein